MIPILVTTEHRGVFAGLVPDDYDLTQRTMRLEQARCAIYWGTTKGFLELAETGPTQKSKIGAPATIEALHDITSVARVTPEAWERWTA